MNHDTHVDSSAEAEVGATSSLTLLFDGLFFICFAGPTDPTTECQVGFLTTAPDHCPQITVNEKVDIGDGVIEKTDYTIDLTPARARDFNTIDLEIPGLGEGNQVTRKGLSATIDREYPNNENKENFKWVIDLENQEMHGRRLTLDQYVLRPVLKIKAGEFYTHELSKAADSVETAYKYDRIEGNLKRKPFGAVAAVIGVRISNVPQDKALLRAGDLVLPIVRKPKTSCLVIFKNRCEEQHPEPEGEHNEVLARESSDFPLYYHAVRDVSALNRFDFKLRGQDHGYPPAVCYGSTGSITTSIP